MYALSNYGPENPWCCRHDKNNRIIHPVATKMTMILYALFCSNTPLGLILIQPENETADMICSLFYPPGTSNAGKLCSVMLSLILQPIITEVGTFFTICPPLQILHHPHRHWFVVSKENKFIHWKRGSFIVRVKKATRKHFSRQTLENKWFIHIWFRSFFSRACSLSDNLILMQGGSIQW